ncbi:MAG TPA: hypothetical protein DER64_02655 [Planctomycetaceae bacterium]|nr:hypothetical protein [Planctomycetaceae bacterium]
MPDRVPDLEKTPTGDVSVNEPEGGTYGEKAELNRLKASLPPMGAPGQQGGGRTAPSLGAPTSAGGGPMGRPKNAPPGVPPALLGPTQRPNTPLGTRLQPGQQTPPMPPRAQAADQQRLMVLDALTTHPDVSAETKEWAALVRDALISERRQ